MVSQQSADHNRLVEDLVRKARTVSRPLPPPQRALAWATIALVLGFSATHLMRTGRLDLLSPGAGWAVANAALAMLFGLMTLGRAFAMSIPGRRPPGRLLAGAVLVGWLATNLGGLSLSDNPVGRLGAGAYCYAFVMLAGAPMLGAVLLALRRTRSLRPAATLAVAGVAISFLAFSLLAFCHPAALRLTDLVAHLAAAVTLIALLVVAGRRWVAA